MDFNSKYKSSKIEELLDQIANGEVDNVYVTDFTFYDLFDVFYSEGEASKAADIASLLAAAQANKIIIVPISSEAKSGCVANLNVYDETIQLWFYYFSTRIELYLSSTSTEIKAEDVWMEDVQSALISGENIKTINGEDILGEGDIELATKEELNGKQDAIADLDAIRSGAEKGATALQSIPSEYVTETELTAKGYATTSALNDKVDKVSGKQLSTEDFTSALKAKLEGLSNYDDTTLANAISGLETRLNTLVSGDASTAIESFNEIMAFLDGIKDTQDLASIIASIEQQIAAKQDTISDLDTIRSGAAKGATALQSYTEKYTGTITGIKMNGASKGTSGVVDLGTVITSHQDISGKQDKLVSGTNIKTINGTSLLGSGDIVISGGGGGGVSQEYVDDAIANAITSTINASY